MSNKRKTTRASVRDALVKMSRDEPGTTLAYREPDDWEVGVLQEFNRRAGLGTVSCCVHLVGGPSSGVVGVYRPTLPSMLLCNDCAHKIPDPPGARCDRCNRSADDMRCVLYSVHERWPVALHAHLCSGCAARARASLT